jgi:hypothetical protein
MTFFSGNRYFNDISWAQTYTNNTLLLAAIKYLKDKEHRFGKIKGICVTNFFPLNFKILSNKKYQIYTLES